MKIRKAKSRSKWTQDKVTLFDLGHEELDKILSCAVTGLQIALRAGDVGYHLFIQLEEMRKFVNEKDKYGTKEFL